MRLPSKDFKVRVGPFTYDVIYSNDVGEMSNSYGSCSHQKLKIYLDDKNPEQQVQDTFWHEIIHCIFSVTGLSNRVNSEVKHHAEEEEIVAVLATAMYQFELDNPFLFDKKEKKDKMVTFFYNPTRKKS